jgi:5-methylcytosine-specific restriction endonuclease McrA
MCGNNFRNNTSKSKYCSSGCERTANKSSSKYTEFAKRQREKYKPVKVLFEERQCVECGKLFNANAKSDQHHCSIRCTKKDGKRKRRAVKKSAFIENVYFNQIYDRDGGMCQICHDKQIIDRNLKAPHPLSASIDHVIPLAKGGTHEPSNCQLAHFICNSRKSDKVMDTQLKLAV